jgi:hypothetical protein
MKIRYVRVPHQAEFHDDITSKYLHLSTGFGGGKSYSLVMKAFQLSRLNQGIPGGCVVPSIADYKKDLLPLFEQILDENRVRYRYHKTDKWFCFPWSSGRLYIVTAEKKIRGPNWGYALGNEITLIPYERYKEVIGRVRIKSAPVPQIASSGTPEGTGHWLYEQFIETPLPRSRIVYGDTRANAANLSDDYIRALEESFDPVMLDAYLRGLFVNMKGSRFYYAYDPARNDNAQLEAIAGLETHVSLDYNVAPMVATLWHVVSVMNGNGVPVLDSFGRPLLKAVAYDQIVIDDGADIHRMSRALFGYGLDPETTTLYPDPAGRARNTAVEGAKSNNTILKECGWHRIKVRSSAPRFRARQLGMNNLLARGLIQLNPKTCRALKKDFEAVEQDSATYEKIKENPKLTHASDGADYFIDLVFPLSGHKPENRSVTIR